MKNNLSSLPIVLDSQALKLVFVLTIFIAFAIPFSLGHPQILVGTIVNACLFLGAVFLPKKFVNSLIFFPSLGVLSRGIIFGPLTSFLLIMLPFIWIGNWLMLFIFKKVVSLVKNDVFGFVGAGVVKALFLFSSALILVNFKVLPRLFLVVMGQTQLITALLGGIVSLVIKEIYVRNSRA